MADEGHPPPQVWRERAACIGTPTHWWFPVDEHGRSLSDVVPFQAEVRCGRCPVQGECYRHALHSERFGVFAGIHEERRAQLRRQSRIRLREQPDLVAVERAISAARAGAALDHEELA